MPVSSAAGLSNFEILRAKTKKCREKTFDLVLSVWKDTKLVCFLSTQSNPVGDQTVNRKQHDGTVIQVPTVPAAISTRTWEVLI